MVREDGGKLSCALLSCVLVSHFHCGDLSHGFDFDLLHLHLLLLNLLLLTTLGGFLCMSKFYLK